MQGPSFLTNPELSLICFGGKGGVGKTTSAVSTSLYLADKNPQKHILLASIDPAHSLFDSLKDTQIFQNLKVWEIDVHVSFQRFKEKYSNTLKKILSRGTFLDEKDISDFFSISLPGMDELMAMTELADLIEGNEYDVIVLDTSPTGHTIKFLQMPHLLKCWMHVLDLMMEKHRYMSKLYQKCYRADDTDVFIETFIKSARKVDRLMKGKSCEFVAVMLPEALSFYETKRFLSTLERHKIPVQNIIINQVYPDSDCSFCKEQYVYQKKYIDRIKQCFSEFNLFEIPLYEEEVHGKELLLKYAWAMMEPFNKEKYTRGTFRAGSIVYD